MADSEKSFQQLDPVSAYSTRPVTLLISVGVVAYAAVESALGWRAVTQPSLAYLALGAVDLAALGGWYFSSPLRGPFRRWGFIVMMGLAVAAMALDAAASWNGEAVPPGEWGPVVVGLIIAQLSHYRPTREIAVATVFATVVAAIIVVLHPATTASTTPEIVVIVETVIPLAALGFGSVAYASALGRSLRWLRSRSDLAARTASDSLRERIVQSVQLERVGILNQQVIPFFSEVLRGSVVDRDEQARAAQISESVRAMMVADVDRTWLDTLVDQIALSTESGRMPGSEVVQDPQHLAAVMSTEQRIVMRVLLVALVAQPGFDPDGFAVGVTRRDGSCVVTVTTTVDRDESGQRSGLAPYLAVLRIAFDDLQVAFEQSALTLRFSYEHK